MRVQKIRQNRFFVLHTCIQLNLVPWISDMKILRSINPGKKTKQEKLMILLTTMTRWIRANSIYQKNQQSRWFNEHFSRLRFQNKKQSENVWRIISIFLWFCLLSFSSCFNNILIFMKCNLNSWSHFFPKPLTHLLYTISEHLIIPPPPFSLKPKPKKNVYLFHDLNM